MTAPRSELRVIFVTVPDQEAGKRIAHSLVEQHLAACVNIIPSIHSVYSWEGRVQSDSEALLVIKTEASKIEHLETKILATHPYSTPEFVVLDPSYVSEKYSRWVSESIGVSSP